MTWRRRTSVYLLCVLVRAHVYGYIGTRIYGREARNLAETDVAAALPVQRVAHVPRVTLPHPTHLHTPTHTHTHSQGQSLARSTSSESPCHCVCVRERETARAREREREQEGLPVERVAHIPRVALSRPTPTSHDYLTEKACKVVAKKPIPAQIRQLVLGISNNNGYVDESVRLLTFAKRLYEHLM